MLALIDKAALATLHPRERKKADAVSEQQDPYLRKPAERTEEPTEDFEADVEALFALQTRNLS